MGYEPDGTGSWPSVERRHPHRRSGVCVRCSRRLADVERQIAREQIFDFALKLSALVLTVAGGFSFLVFKYLGIETDYILATVYVVGILGFTLTVSGRAKWNPNLPWQINGNGNGNGKKE